MKHQIPDISSLTRTTLLLRVWPIGCCRRSGNKSTRHHKQTHRTVIWQDHGMAFMIHDKKKFIDTIMPMWFPGLKHASWVRQLSMFGFKRILRDGKDKYHESCIRDIPELATTMQKVKRNGNTRGSNTPDSSPFWAQTTSAARLCL
jgi:hypothetical protein